MLENINVLSMGGHLVSWQDTSAHSHGKNEAQKQKLNIKILSREFDAHNDKIGCSPTTRA